MTDRITINLESGCVIKVHLIHGHNQTVFQIFVDGDFRGTVYPDPEDAFIEWKSDYGIDPQLVQLIGKAIENNEA